MVGRDWFLFLVVFFFVVNLMARGKGAFNPYRGEAKQTRET